MKQGTLKTLGVAALGAAFAAAGAGAASAYSAPPLTGAAATPLTGAPAPYAAPDPTPPLTGTVADQAMVTAAHHATYRTEGVSGTVDRIALSQADTIVPDAVPGEPPPRRPGGLMDSLPLSGTNPLGQGIPADQVNAADAQLPGQPL